MRTAGYIALAGGVFFLASLLVITLLDSGGSDATTAQQSGNSNPGRLVLATATPVDDATGTDFAAIAGNLLRAANERTAAAHASLDVMEASADADGHGEGCTTEVERGDGWERTTTVCVQQVIERDGNSISVSTSTSTSTSTRSTN